MVRKILLIAILLTAFFSGNAQSIKQIGQNNYIAGVPTEEFDYMRANSVNGGRQIQSNWCWAACIQMVLNYHGLYVKQQDVVRKIYGNHINRPANEQQILAALSGWAPDSRGRFSSIYAYSGYTSVSQIVQNLSHKWPLIVGMRMPGSNIGHAYVLTAIYYQLDRFGNPIPYRVVLRDPWPSNRSRQEMSWNEFSRRAFMGMKVYVRRH